MKAVFTSHRQEWIPLLAVTTALLSSPLTADVLPQPVAAEIFAELKTHSPFQRSIALSDSLVLTGMARIEGRAYATVFNSDSRESLVVSENSSSGGWQLVGVRGNEADLESITARIQINGAEVVSIRYREVDMRPLKGGTSGGNGGRGGSSLSEEQIEDARRAARNPAEGFRGDGYRGPPPPEIMEKLRRITPEQREQIARRIMQMRNDGVDSDERRRIYSEALDRAARGR